MQDRSVGRTVMVILAAVVAAGGVSAAVTGVRPGFAPKGVTLAAGMPDWNISEICASDSAGGQCRILEAEAQRTISGGWGMVPESFRKACMDSVKSPYDKSYRLLSQCLEAQVLKGLDKDLIDTATTAGKQAQAAPAVPAAKAEKAAPGASGDGKGFAVLPTTSTADLFKMRESWGTGAAPKKVDAPLAAGASSPLPSQQFAVPKGFDGQPTVHPLVQTPVAQLTPIPQDKIAAELKKLLAEREGWLKAPSTAAPAGNGSGSGYAVLPTTSVADLVKMRESWGAGASAKKVAAPLAAGARSPLPSQQFAVPKGFSGQSTVHPLKETPVAQLTPVPQDKIAAELKKLLAEREGWGAAPSKVAAAPAAAPKSAEAAACEAKLEEAASKGVILFQTSSARIDTKSNATLDSLAKIAKGCSKGRIRVGGHTDSRGRAAFNKTLSERRAQAVADYLTKAGVPKARVEAVGYGSEKPVADNDTSEGRARNRRIEFDVLD